MRRILVTGANKGIGLALVAKILEHEADTYVLLGSRNKARGEEALRGLVEAHADWAPRVEVLEIDVSKDASVASAAEQVAAKFGRESAPLYGVVNNAGIGLGSMSLKEVLEVNTYGIHRVCEAFMPLVEPKGGRIVNQTSASGPMFVAKCDAEMQALFTNPELEWSQLAALMEDCLALEGAEAFAAKGLADGAPYGLSKACGNAYTLLLAREHPSLKVNACTPGFIETDLTRVYAESSGRSPAEMGMKQADEGCDAALHLLFGEPLGSGHYYGSDAKRSPLDRYRAPGSAPYEGS